MWLFSHLSHYGIGLTACVIDGGTACKEDGKGLYHECGFTHTSRLDSKPDSVDNEFLLRYNTPVKQHQRSFKRICSRVFATKSQQAADAFKSRELYNERNSNNNNNDDVQLGLRRSRPRCGISRSKSFSEVLTLPRVETAFVGDEAYTVYHGAPRFVVLVFFGPSINRFN